jgi:single-strand DNA-binding protein
MSANRAILLGNVGKDPEIRSAQSGDRIASFSLATSEQWKDKSTGEKKEATEWHNVVVFNQNLIPVIEQYVKKGGRVYIEGQIKTRKWQDKEGQNRWSTEIVLGKFDGKLSLEGSPSSQPKAADEHSYGTTSTREAPKSSGQTFARDMDDEIPFAPEFR